jgi:hypothetical protein
MAANGERVKGGNEKTAGPGLHRDIAQRRERQPVVGLKIMKQTALAAVGQDFIMNVEENLRRQNFDLEIGLIIDAVGTG